MEIEGNARKYKEMQGNIRKYGISMKSRISWVGGGRAAPPANRTVYCITGSPPPPVIGITPRKKRSPVHKEIPPSVRAGGGVDRMCADPPSPPGMFSSSAGRCGGDPIGRTPPPPVEFFLPSAEKDPGRFRVPLEFFFPSALLLVGSA